MTSWLATDGCDEAGDYKIYCDCEKLIELIVEKAQDMDNLQDIEQKQDEGAEVAESPRHKKCPMPTVLRTSKVQPLPAEHENLLTEKLLRERAESGELGVRVGGGVLSLQIITDATEGCDLLLKRVDNANSNTLKMLSEIPEYTSTILAVCFDATKEDLARLENAVKGPSFCWKVGPILNDTDESKDDEDIKRELTDQDFEAFIAIARATVVLHEIQSAGF